MATDGGGVDSGRQVAGTARGSGGEGAGWGWGGPREKDRRGVRPGMGGSVEGRRARRRGVRASERGAVDNLITKASWQFGRLRKRLSQKYLDP